MTDTLSNPELEAELLGTILNDNFWIDPVADLIDSRSFGESVHGRIFEAALREFGQGNIANPITLKGYFENDPDIKLLGGVTYLAQLTGFAGFNSATDLARQVSNLARRRTMREGLASASTACSDLQAEFGDILDEADAALSQESRQAIHQPSGAECFDELIAGFDSEDKGVTCGHIRELDRLLGPLKPKQLVIGAGRPGMGKTALALSYALGAARSGHGVLFVSLEMSSHELAARMAADLCFDTETKVPFDAIRDGKLSAAQRRKIAEARDFIGTLPFQVIDAGSLTVGRLNMLVRRHARKMAAQGHKLELVVVDYLQLLHADRKGISTYEAVSEVSRTLKAIAKDNTVAIMALAQLSREVEKRPDKRPQLSDLRDSGQIEQDADAVMFLLRSEYYLRQAEPDEMDPKRIQWDEALEACKGQIEFIVAKRRNGVTGTATGQFHGMYQAVRS